VRIEYFGANRQLLGAFHIPQRLQPRSAAVLLCNPFGEEASRAHRTYRVLATQLERAGFSVLRFDYAGTGDSLGSGSDGTLAAWGSDIEAAAEKLRSVSGASRIALVGLRLGATLAMLASVRGLRPRHLVMWDPIVDGGAYLRELVSQHRAYMREELGDGWRDRLQNHGNGMPTEVFGAPVNAALAAEFAALDLAAAPVVADNITVIATRASAEGDRLRAKLPPHARWIEMTENTTWNSDAALNAMIVPMDIVQAVVANIEKSCP
jgi:pimeloyl-ACP methyl ester carboxylesterase